MQYKAKEMIKHKNWQIYKMNPHKHTRTALSICSFLCSIIFHYPQCIHLFAFMFDFEWPGRENQNMQKQTAKTRIKFNRMNQMEFRLIRLMEAIAFQHFYLDGLLDSVPELLLISICTVCRKIQSKHAKRTSEYKINCETGQKCTKNERKKTAQHLLLCTRATR